jgi:hypothetical protein
VLLVSAIILITLVTSVIAINEASRNRVTNDAADLAASKGSTQEPFDFTLTSDWGGRFTTCGIFTVTISVLLKSGSPQPVRLFAEYRPSAVSSARFSQSYAIPNFTSELTVETANVAAPRIQPARLTIVAEAPGIIHTLTLGFTVYCGVIV